VEQEENGKKNGGARPGAGRKPKADEIALIERLKPYDELALTVLGEMLEKRSEAALKLFYGYRWGQPRQTIDANIAGQLDIYWQEERTYEKPGPDEIK